MRVTLEMIAKRCRCSKVTVSLALRGSSRISAKTRHKVAAVATELGYVPNPMVSALMTSLRITRETTFNSNLGFVTAFAQRDAWREIPSFPRHFAGAQARAAALGFGMEIIWMGDPEFNGKNISRVMRNRGIQGIILAPLPVYGAQLGLDWDSFATVALGRTFNEAPAHHVSNNQFHTIHLALEQSRLHGYQRIGLALPKFVDEKVDHLWLAGLLSWQAMHPELPAVRPLFTENFTETEVIDWIRREQPDTVLASHGPVWDWMQHHQATLPVDLGYVHLNWTPERGEVSGVNQQPELVGAAAVELLSEQINHNSRGTPANPKTITLDSLWHEGTTCPSRR